MTAKMKAREAVAAVENAVAMAQYESRWTEDDGAEHSAGLATLTRLVDAAEKVGDGSFYPECIDGHLLTALAAALNGEDP